MFKQLCKQHFPIILLRQPISRQRPIMMRYFVIRPALVITFIYSASLLLCYSGSYLYNFILIHPMVPIGCPKRKTLNFWKHPSISILKKYTFPYKDQKKFDEAQYSFYLKVLSLKVFALGCFSTTLEEFKVIYPDRISDYITRCEKNRNFTKFPGVEILWKGTVPA